MIVLMLVAMAALKPITIPTTPPVADPLAPARAGKLLCQTPDRASKASHVLNHYSFAADGSIRNQVEALLIPDRAVNMKFETPVVVRDNATCSTFEAFRKGALFEDGKPADAELINLLIPHLTNRTAVFGNKEACTVYRADDEGYVALTTVAGVEAPVQPERFIWVDPADGWVVRAANLKKP